MRGRLTILPVLFATSLSGQSLPRQINGWVPFTKGVQPSIKQYIPASPTPDSSSYQADNIYGQAPDNIYYQSAEETGDAYYVPPELSAEDSSNVISEKNYKPPEVATASTGGLPFIVYALKNIFWLFVIGTIFIMFVGTISAFAYRWTHAYHGGSFGRITDLDTTEIIYKALQIWRDIEEAEKEPPIKKLQ